VREYQYLRTLLVRETAEKRAELSIYLQPAAGEAARAGVDQLVPPERLLTTFPDRLGKDEKDAEKRYLDLTSYDVIVAFDPDWTRVSADQLKLLRQWVDNGGGLILAAGPLYTYQLAAPKTAASLKAVNDLLPVNVADSRLALDRKTDRPFRLTFAEGKTDVPFLKLGEDPDKPMPFWDAYFGAEKEPPIRGFYGCHPVKSAKPGATVLATFADPTLKTADDKPTPYLATMPVGKGRVAYLGSAEMWRVRGYQDRAHDRFWLGLIRYAGRK
jgi:hypothetical protein